MKITSINSLCICLSKELYERKIAKAFYASPFGKHVCFVIGNASFYL